jgi:hypothetical protein
MTGGTIHRLEGLEPDNLLAFLALLGLLRTLEAVGWRPRSHWQGPPMRPVLSLPAAVTRAEVAMAAARGCAALAADYDFDGRESLNYTVAEFRGFCRSGCCYAQGCPWASAPDGSPPRPRAPGNPASAPPAGASWCAPGRVDSGR